MTIALWQTRVPASPRVWLADIAASVANAHGITVADIRGPCTKRRCAWPRQEAMYRAKNETRLSTTQIGRFFSRDHTTVMHAIRAHAERMAMAE